MQWELFYNYTSFIWFISLLALYVYAVVFLKLVLHDDVIELSSGTCRRRVRVILSAVARVLQISWPYPGFKQAQPKMCHSPKVDDGVEIYLFTS